MSVCVITDSEIVSDLRRVARLLNHSPSSVEYRRYGRYNVRTVQRRFNRSWRQIIEGAGLRYTPRTCHRIPSTEELQSDLRSVMREIDHPPTRSEYQARGSFGAETVRRRSGQKRWEDAVASLIGVSREEVKRYQRKGGCYRTTDEWLAKLRQLSQKLGHAPTTRESNEAGINAHQLRLRVGGSWTDVLKVAGIDLQCRTRHARLLSTSTDELIEDVVRVSREIGRVAKMREYERSGRYSCTAIRGRVGGWRRVKKVVRERLAGGESGLKPCSDLDSFRTVSMEISEKDNSSLHTIVR